MKYNFDEIINRENTNSIKWDLRETVFKNKDVIPLWIADMDFKTPNFVINALRERLNHEILAYAYRPDSFFLAARNWVKRRHNWEVTIEDLTFTPGVVAALEFAVQCFTKENDKILIQPPVYPPFFTAVKNQGRILIENTLIENEGVYSIDFKDFENKLADGVRMFIFCSPHNPIGRVWTKDELNKIADLCLKYNVIIVSDEIHSDLVFEPHQHTPIASLSEQIAQQTLTCLAPSKTFNLAGLSTAIVHSSNKTMLKQFKDCVENYHVQLGTIFGNIALETAYNLGDNWLNQLLVYIKSNINWVKGFLNENIPVIKTHNNEATYLMWLDFRSLNLDQENLNKFLIFDAGLGLNCGTSFGKEGKGFMRLNVACPRETLVKAMHQLKKAIDRKF